MITRRGILALTATAVVLFVLLAVLAALAMLLSELGDADGALVVRRFLLVDMVLLVVDLICILLALAVRAIEPPPPRRRPRDGQP